MAEETHDQLRREAELLLAVSKRVVNAVEDRVERDAAGGVGPTGERYRKLIPKAKNMTEAKKAEARIAESLLYGAGEPECPPLSTFLEETYLPWARQNHSAPHLDERIVRVLSYVHASGSQLREALETVSITKVGQPADTKISAAG